jgi:hypothetical protein
MKGRLPRREGSYRSRLSGLAAGFLPPLRFFSRLRARSRSRICPRQVTLFSHLGVKSYQFGDLRHGQSFGEAQDLSGLAYDPC